MPTVFSKPVQTEAPAEVYQSDSLDRLDPISSEDEITEAGDAFANRVLKQWTQIRTYRYITDNEGQLALMNGQMTMEIHDWHGDSPKFILRNNPTGNQKGEMNVVLREGGFVRVDFKMPLDYPEGMAGFAAALEGFFGPQRELGIVNIELGCDKVNQESRQSKNSKHHIKWTNPWDNYGCRVNWTKPKAKSNTLKIKIVIIKSVSPAEQMVMTIDERSEFYKGLSHGDPNLFGKWIAMPARVWLRTMWMASQIGSIDKKLFGKLPVDEEKCSDESALSPPSKKSKKKHKRKQKKGKRTSPGRSMLEANEEETQQATERQVTTEVTEISETLEPVAASEAQSPTEELATDIPVASSEVVSHPEPESLDPPKRMESGGEQVDLVVQESKQKEASAFAGASGEVHTPQFTRRRGYLLKGVQTNFPYKGVPTEQQLATVAGQNPVTASLSPRTPSSLPISATSFGTAGSNLSPSTLLPSSSPAQFFTPMGSPADERDILGELGPIVEEEVEVEIRYPVPNKGDELSFSDSEEYTRDCMEGANLPPRSRFSFHAFPSGLFEARGEAVLSPSTDPPSNLVPFGARVTTDDAELGTEQSCSNHPSHNSKQARAESVVAHNTKGPTKKKQKKWQKRKEKRFKKTRESLEPSLPASSLGHGVEGRIPSPHGTSRDEEVPPGAMQLGGSGAPSASGLDLRTVGVRCAKVDCDAVCGYADGVSVVCPGCGPFSYVRYCGKHHLWEDAKAHWLYCGTASMQEMCMATSIPYDVLVGPPMLPGRYNSGLPERHRQALWFSTASDQGDYFLFTDWTDIMAAEDQPEVHLELRCSPRVAYTVRFEDAAEKDRFRRCLAICLFAAVEYPALVDYVYRLIRDWLVAHNFWASDNNMDNMLAYQLGLEFGHLLKPSCRHACETEWVGANPRDCQDPMCASERRPTSSDDWCMGMGFRRLCDYLEYKHWILRAHRTTHATISDVVACTCGIGFPGVLQADRRFFRRGEGWDGVGAGPMELEW
ncbi:uncharacterized protein N7515_003586 [Penicillium bovifimosum]|uniref:Uncharacterized protein n=1 Tax=Penicillium bovifimosum TaxID=126998 RepID=A0A9W9H539_9EURO|nr:uncharacterized protein N7515_003586 [Penicillium bovifimosum]KAJ5138738.1 hypothetical protein N7515_003586 [Penicillium bovifimosum]